MWNGVFVVVSWIVWLIVIVCWCWVVLVSGMKVIVFSDCLNSWCNWCIGIYVIVSEVRLIVIYIGISYVIMKCGWCLIWVSLWVIFWSFGVCFFVSFDIVFVLVCFMFVEVFGWCDIRYLLGCGGDVGIC